MAMKAYKCDICGKLFANNDNRTATGLVICHRKCFRRYEGYLADVCPECNDAFHKLVKELKEDGNERSDS